MISSYPLQNISYFYFREDFSFNTMESLNIWTKEDLKKPSRQGRNGRFFNIHVHFYTRSWAVYEMYIFNFIFLMFIQIRQTTFITSCLERERRICSPTAYPITALRRWLNWPMRGRCGTILLITNKVQMLTFQHLYKNSSVFFQKQSSLWKKSHLLSKRRKHTFFVFNI